MTLLRHVSGRALWLALGIVVALAVAFRHEEANALESWQASGMRELETTARYQQKLGAFQRQAIANRHHFDRLSQDTARLRETLRLTQAHADELAHQVDSAYKAPLSASVRRIGEACGELSANCEARVLAATQALDAERASHLLASARAATADSLIQVALRVTQCHFLFFKCPSRTRVAEVFFVLGVGTGLVVGH
jgi:exonuclease VII large subunit